MNTFLVNFKTFETNSKVFSKYENSSLFGGEYFKGYVSLERKKKRGYRLMKKIKIRGKHKRKNLTNKTSDFIFQLTKDLRLGIEKIEKELIR